MTNPEIRAKHRDEILRLYYDEFATVLKKIGFRGKVPTLLDFRIEMLRWGAFDLFQSFNMVSMQFIDVSKLDFNKMAENPTAAIAEVQKLVAESEGFQEHLKETVKRLLVKGVIG